MESQREYFMVTPWLVFEAVRQDIQRAGLLPADRVERLEKAGRVAPATLTPRAFPGGLETRPRVVCRPPARGMPFLIAQTIPQKKRLCQISEKFLLSIGYKKFRKKFGRVPTAAAAKKMPPQHKQCWGGINDKREMRGEVTSPGSV
ncbi:hypothetical protein [uncultured Desulfovibrio sp.]|uniref:hypothetical protein n=1 Tax=uncultured Desulfovibrio sp. TaxID=167968 RepID=UPI002673F60B|nr:hypothetical protein [uncultured Desulfovibrio sp.]